MIKIVAGIFFAFFTIGSLQAQTGPLSPLIDSQAKAVTREQATVLKCTNISPPRQEACKAYYQVGVDIALEKLSAIQALAKEKAGKVITDSDLWKLEIRLSEADVKGAEHAVRSWDHNFFNEKWNPSRIDPQVGLRYRPRLEEALNYQNNLCKVLPGSLGDVCRRDWSELVDATRAVVSEGERTEKAQQAGDQKECLEAFVAQFRAMAKHIVVEARVKQKYIR